MKWLVVHSVLLCCVRIGCLLRKVLTLVISVFTEPQCCKGLPVTVACMTVLRLWPILCLRACIVLWRAVVRLFWWVVVSVWLSASGLLLSIVCF